MIENIKFFFSGLYIDYSSIKQGIKNFWKYRKVIWNDRWYDYGFMTDLLEVKLKDMRDNWKYSHYVDSEKEQEVLNKLCDLIDEYKLKCDLFCDKDSDKIRKEFFELLSDNYEKFWD